MSRLPRTLSCPWRRFTFAEKLTGPDKTQAAIIVLWNVADETGGISVHHESPDACAVTFRRGPERRD